MVLGILSWLAAPKSKKSLCADLFGQVSVQGTGMLVELTAEP